MPSGLLWPQAKQRFFVWWGWWPRPCVFFIANYFTTEGTEVTEENKKQKQNKTTHHKGHEGSRSKNKIWEQTWEQTWLSLVALSGPWWLNFFSSVTLCPLW